MEFAKNFIILAFGSGFALGVTNAVISWVRHRQKNNDKLRYFAIRLAFVFEHYGTVTVSNISGGVAYRVTDGHAGRELDSSLPAFNLPEEDAYELMDHKLLNEVLRFQQKWSVCCADILSLIDLQLRDELPNKVEEHALTLGIDALRTAAKLREKFSLEKSDLKWGSLTFLEYLEERLREVKLEEARPQGN